MADQIAGSAPAAGTPPAGTPPAGAGTPPEGAKPPVPGANNPPAGDNPPPAGQKPGEGAAAAAKRKLKAIIDGKEIEADEDEVIKGFQRSKAADKRFEDAAKMRKQAETFINLLKRSANDPKVLEEIIAHPSIGGNFKKIAEQYLYDIIQRESMTPEQRELAETKEKLSQFEREKQEAEKAETQRQMTELQNKYTKEYQTQIIQALDKSGLPKSEFTISRMARYMHMGLTRGVELKADDVLDLVRQDYYNDLRSFGTLPADKLVEILGEDVIKKLREFDLAKVRGSQGGGEVPPTQQEPKPASGKKPLTTEEFRKLAAQRAAQ